MKLSLYKEYKKTGIEWLGIVPKHWNVIKLKRIVSTPITDGPHETPDKLDGGIPFVSAEAIKGETIDFDKKWGFISLEDHKRYSIKYRPKRDDIYVIKSGATTGNVAIVETDVDFNIWSPLAAIRANQELAFPRFVFNFLKSKEYRTSVQLGWSFGTQQNIGMNVLENLFLPLPPLPEQKSIAAFLDRETARIDSLIAKKRKQIELLRRKRAALISQAVTKGLDPKAKMKDSGVEWLGKVPENWSASRLKFFTKKIGSGKTPKGGSETYIDSGVMLLRSQNIHFDSFRLDDVVFVGHEVDEEMANTRVQSFDVLLNITGASIGRCNIVPANFEPANVNQHVCIIRTNQNLLFPNYLRYSICSSLIQSQIFSSQMGTSREGLNFDDIGNFILCIPASIQEQKEIAAYLDQWTVKLDATIAKIELSIDKINTYRTSLISSAVTGKIDVRRESEVAA
jgi:type I restriction enzyme S subunit